MNGPLGVVTGAGSGIGRAIAQELSLLGMHLVLIGRRRHALAETADTLPGSSDVLVADIGACNDVEAIANFLKDQGRGLRVLVNNAAVVHPALIGASTAQQVDELFRTNMIGPVLLVNSVWPLLLAEADDSGRSTVVNISSMATIDPFPELFAYATSKAGLNIMVRSIHNQGGSRGVRAFAIAPGSVETQMLRAVVSEGVLPTERTLAPADVARVVGQCVQGVRDEFSGSVIVLTSP